MELTRTYHRATTTGLELRMTIKNVGTIPCSTTVILTRTPADFTDLTENLGSEEDYCVGALTVDKVEG